MSEKDLILRVAELARLELDEAERDRFAKQFGDILGYVEQLSSLDTTDVEPAIYAVDVVNALRPDEPLEPLPREESMRNNPVDDDTYFRVPKVLD